MNAGETDTDCGGPCPPCVTGKLCKVGPDCATGVCAQGFCCNTDCSAACNSCRSADTGMANGTCAAVLATQNDPEGRCAKGSCDGGGKCHCKNGIGDFDENGLDCGGSCGGCPGQACTTNTFCASGFCSDGVCCNEDCGAKGLCYSCTLTSPGSSGGPVSWLGQCTPAFTGTDGKCAPGSACAPDHTCVAGKSLNGANCTSNDQCASGYCATSFDGQCHSHGAPGDPCTAQFNCTSAVCNTTTHLCQ